MKISVVLANNVYGCDLSASREISIPLRFDGPQPHAFGAPAAGADVLRGGSFVGDVRQGGSCNCEQYAFVPHCNGTHTECIGHITAERIGVAERLRDAFFPALLVSVPSVPATETKESYQPLPEPRDRLLTETALRAAVGESPREFLHGLIVRTLPNPEQKREQDYDREAAPYFSHEGMRFIRSLGVRHLIVDIPSVDRAADEGRLSNHRIFWDMAPGEASESERSLKTITEMAFIPDSINDGVYLTSVQIPHFMTDAAPSRVLLFDLTPER